VDGEYLGENDVSLNERIRELMIEAGYAAPELAGRGQKLAELIINECAEQCEELAEKLGEQRPNLNYDIVAYECAETIKSHFGIE
jgi:hypothetical protein